MGHYGYAGTILYVDLTSGKIEKRPLDLEMARSFLGGWGINNRLIWDLLKPGMDPFSPEAPIVIGTGPLCGTTIPGSGKVSATYKRPVLANPTKEKYAVSTAVGGSQRFGAMLKSAGYDHVVITGRSPKPCYLYIGSDGVRIIDAPDLWGKDVYETTDELTRRHSRVSGGCGVWTTGRAGENLVKWAIAFVDKKGTMGRIGGGALLGSKNLKAVVTWGDRGLKVADPPRFLELANRKRDEILHVPGWGLNYGVHGGGAISPDYPKEIFAKTRLCKTACAMCFGPEYDVLRIPDGRFAGTTMQSSKLWEVRDFGPYLKLRDYRDMIKLIDVYNRTGLDLLTASRMFRVLCRAYETGRISAKDTGGLELKLGDLDCYFKLVDMIVNREHIGAVCAEGWYVLGQKLGMDALDDFRDGIPIVKGHDTLYDARFSRLNPTTLGNVVFSKPQHTHAATHYFKEAESYHGHAPEDVRPFLQTFDGIKWDFSARMVTTRADFERVFTEDSLNIGRFARHAEDCKGVYNSLSICDISPYGFRDPMRDIPFLAEAYCAATGISMTALELKRRGEAVWNLDRLLNVREGLNREDDKFPEVWARNTEVPIKLRKGDSYVVDWFGKRVMHEDLKRILDDYYDERGWNVETGVPTKRKLRELGLEEFILSTIPD